MLKLNVTKPETQNTKTIRVFNFEFQRVQENSKILTESKIKLNFIQGSAFVSIQ